MSILAHARTVQKTLLMVSFERIDFRCPWVPVLWSQTLPQLLEHVEFTALHSWLCHLKNHLISIEFKADFLGLR